MRSYHFPSVKTEHQTIISRFGGADFRSHPTKVTLTRSPDLQNLVCDRNDFLVKRTGWKTVERYDAPVYGVFPAPDGEGAFVHAGVNLYFRPVSGAQSLLCSSMNGAFSQAFTMNGVLYLLDGACFRAVRRNGGAWTAERVQDSAYVPTTTVSASPAGGGTSLEAVNLLTGRRINTSIGDGKSTEFCLDAAGLDRIPLTAAVNGAEVAIASVDYDKGRVALASAPPDGQGHDNVSIAFSKTVPGAATKINRCRIAGLYGGKNDTRVFLAGNPDEPHCDWQSGLYDPSYFPDTGYARMGTEASAIAGYLKQYESQIIVKTGGAQEATSFARTFVMTDDGASYFSLRQGAHGEGAVAPRSFAMLGDLPLFLSAQGVMGVYGTAVAEQNTIRPISEAVCPRLIRETALEKACAAVFEGRYYLALNGNVYVADSHLTEEDGFPAWFFWANVPAQCLAVLDDRLWFGTADGRLCRFSLPDEADAYTDDGEAIDAYWCTPTLSLSDWSRNKTIRDVIPTLMPYARSSAELCFTDEGGETQRLSRSLDLFSFGNWDFGRVSFRCVPGAVSWRSHRRRYRRPLHTLRIGNDRAGEPFGLLALTLRWTEGGSI
mgnify:CR=1 FL=1